MPINVLDNPNFDEGLDDWTTDGVIVWSDGYPRAGCVKLTDGQSLSQTESVSSDQLYTLHYFYKLGADASLTVSYGSISQTHAYEAPASRWIEGVLPFAITESANDSVTFEASGGTVHVDTVSLMVGGLPISRTQLATRLSVELSAFATDKSLSTAPDSVKGPEGDYTLAIDAALRAMGAVNRHGDPDVVKVNGPGVNSLIEEATDAMLGRLRRIYSLDTDVSLGPRRESRSQISKMLGDQLDKGSQTVAVRRLRHRAEDFKL